VVQELQIGGTGRNFSRAAFWSRLPKIWGMTAHGLFILQCSNYLVMHGGVESFSLNESGHTCGEFEVPISVAASS
jgi:hypothetical protein